MIGMLVCALLIPNFGPALSLVGGTFNCLLSLIFPIWFYMSLQSEYHPAKKVFLSFIFIMALVAAAGNAFVETKNLIRVIQGKYKTV